MNVAALGVESMVGSPPSSSTASVVAGDMRPLVSLVVPAFNEAALIQSNLTKLCRYMESLESLYRWEIVVVNDGSLDNTGELVEAFARRQSNVRVYHHITNFGLGQAFKFAFRHCRGEYILTLDADLSYSPNHIQRLLAKVTETRAKIVVASPYMEGGKSPTCQAKAPP